MGVFVTEARNGCFETGDAASDFTGAIGRRQRLEPNDASSRTVQHTSGYNQVCDPFFIAHAAMCVGGLQRWIDGGWRGQRWA
ncbi:hypothetical protein B296_00022333 [Ensete ventricosum]|uniref:Uncharacterized protein n=1 Tax=Ensete ventricosum TaxID=4639 RepID=A0A426YRH6_ENSVE|nr:hypothetical protein B296_00022333 [Ensete ventricosum]